MILFYVMVEAAAPQAPCLKNIVHFEPVDTVAVLASFIWDRIKNHNFKPEPVYAVAVVAATIWDHIKNFIIKLEPVYAVAIVTATI